MSLQTKVIVTHAWCLALIALALAASWYVPALRANPTAAYALIGAVCAWYGKAVGKPLDPVMISIISKLEPPEVARLSGKPPAPAAAAIGGSK